MRNQEGNQYAAKWTLEDAQKLIHDIHAYVVGTEKCFSLAKACSYLGYYETLLDYLNRRFEALDFEPIKKAKEVIKARLIEKGLTGDNQSTMSIFILKNNHDMKDKTEREDTRINKTPLSDEERENAVKALKNDY
jgi:hypothetical protein